MEPHYRPALALHQTIECGIYDAAYDTGVEGTYHVDISAISDGIQTGFETTFDVASFIEFDIIRTAQSKIDPVNNPNEFEVVIDVTSHTNATDIQIVESVPSVFDIISDGNVTETVDGKSSHGIGFYKTALHRLDTRIPCRSSSLNSSRLERQSFIMEMRHSRKLVRGLLQTTPFPTRIDIRDLYR